MKEENKEINEELNEELNEETQAVEDVIAAEEEVDEKTQEELLQEQVSELEDRNLRLQAEIVNMRNRNQKDREAAAKYRAQDIARDLLPAIDNLERALETEVVDENGENLKKGVQMVLEGLNNTLKAHGIEVLAPLGEEFDPNFHQAVQTLPVEEGQKANEVVQVFQKGYKLHDRVLRPAMVVVAQ